MDRSRRLTAWWLVALCTMPTLAIPARASAQAPDKAPAPVSGTTHIRGRVVARDSGQPLARATVSLYSNRDAALSKAQSTLTDNDGRYEFRNVSAGQFGVVALMDGYVTMSNGQNDPDDYGRSLEIERWPIGEINFALPRAGVITGRVTSAAGRPVERAIVRIYRVTRRSAGYREIRPFAPILTDAKGRYRQPALPIGSYYVGVITPSGLDPGATAGSKAILATPQMYYPGTPLQAQAKPLTLAAGSHLTADVQLLPVKGVRVSGTVVDTKRRPIEGIVRLLEPDGLGSASREALLQPDGTFTLQHVPEGRFRLEVHSPDGEGALQPLTVTGHDDVAGLHVTTSPGATLRGRLVVEGTPDLGQTPHVVVGCQTTDGALSPHLGEGDLVQVFARQTFQLTGIFFPCTLVAIIADSSMHLARVLVRGVDMTDRPIDLTKDVEPVDATLVIHAPSATLTATIQGERPTIPGDCVIIAFSQNKADWTPTSSRVDAKRGECQRPFTIEGLPAGDYHVVALARLDKGAERDPIVLGALAPQGVAARLTEGRRAAVTIKLATEGEAERGAGPAAATSSPSRRAPDNDADAAIRRWVGTECEPNIYRSAGGDTDYDELRVAKDCTVAAFRLSSDRTPAETGRINWRSNFMSLGFIDYRIERDGVKSFEATEVKNTRRKGTYIAIF